MYAMQSTDAKTLPRQAPFDTDSGLLRIDNCATRSISPYTEDFIGKLTPLPNRKVQGIGGKVGRLMSGTIKWDIEDDEGVVHSIRIPNSIYLPQAPSRLLSPQHWAQEARDNVPVKNGTWCATYGTQVVLYWGQQQFKRTIALDKEGSNVASIRTAPGFDRYKAFCTEIGEKESGRCQLAFDTGVVSDDESDDDARSVSSDSDEDSLPLQREQPLRIDFDLDGPTPEASKTAPVVVEDEEDCMPQDASAEFLKWHHRLGHASPRKIQMLAKMGILPKRLVNCRVPLCTACLFGKATRRPWRSKTPNNADETSRTVMAPGDCVSIDQLESPTPGLIAQLKGIPTKQRYKVATVFVDHFSRLSYVHLQKTTNAEETLEAKKAFEQFA